MNCFRQHRTWRIISLDILQQLWSYLAIKMKILEAQSATLTNYEVYTHLVEQRARYAKKEMQGRRPGNLETVVKEVGLTQEQYEFRS
jgi:formate dehydrogenase maturation protein FdhE